MDNNGNRKLIKKRRVITLHSCSVCGVLVNDQELHVKWHRANDAD